MPNPFRDKPAEELSTLMASLVNEMCEIGRQSESLTSEEMALRSRRTNLDNRKSATQRQIREITEEIHRRAGIRETKPDWKPV